MINTEKNLFINDQFIINGIFICKYISSVYTEEYKNKIGKEKLKFDIVNDPINNIIIDQLRAKELYFLEKISNVTGVKYPLNVKSFLTNNSEFIINEIKIKKDSSDKNVLIIKKQILEKEETNYELSKNVTSISLKIDFNTKEKNIRPIKSNIMTNLCMNDIIELVKSEKLKLHVQIKCSAVFINNKFYISGSLIKLSLEQSKMAQIYTELKIKSENTTKNKKNDVLLPKNKIVMSQFSTKAKTITSNIVNILM